MQKDHIDEDQDGALPVLNQRKSSSSNVCDVCFEPYHIMGRWPMLACPHEHFFCDQCIEGMFQINADEPVPCPICRALIRHTKVKPHYQLFRAINKQTHLKKALKEQENELFMYAFRHQIFEVAMAFKSGKIDTIAKMTRLDCSNRKICKVQHMSAFPHLVYLRLDRNIIATPSGLETLSSLRYLNLSHNCIKDILSLSGIKSLTHLAVEFNQIQEITSLIPFSHLSHWFLYGNPLKPVVIDELLLVEFKNLLTLSLSCMKEEAVTQVFLRGLSTCQTMPRLSKVFIKGTESQKSKRKITERLRNKVAVQWLQDKEAEHLHSRWLQQFFSDNEQYGQVYQFKLDPESPYIKQYKLEGDKLTKLSGNFIIINGQYCIRKEGKVNLKIKIQTVCEDMLMGLCNGFIKHNANMYSEHFAGLTFWGYSYCRGDQTICTRKLRLSDKPVIRMCVDFEENQIRWFSDDNEVCKVPFPQQFKHSSLYFLIGIRDKDTVVTILSE